MGELMRMPAREYDRWKQFYALRPFGETAAYLRSAQVAQTLVNLNRDQKKHPQGFPLRDFLLFYEPPPLSDDEVGDKIARLLGAPDMES